MHTSDRYLSNSMTGQAPGDTRVANNRPGAGAELRHYHLKCHFCGAVFKDDGSLLECPVEHAPSLLVSQYSARQLRCDNSAEGIYRYRGWLPIVRELSGSGRTVTFQSAKLRHITGLPNLWVAFNGYWPEKGASLKTATFKELEAYSVLSRVSQNRQRVLVVASAGNTAAAFARTCSENRIPCLIIIPSSGLERMRFVDPLDRCVRIVSLGGAADYYDAIALAEHVSHRGAFFQEGGAMNIARRDGLATTVLNAVETIGQLPEYYFQAIGSGTGGIAAYEAAKRLLNDGRFGQRLPRLMLSQNFPFAPMYYSWKLNQRELVVLDRDLGKAQIREIEAKVLSNQRPSYSVAGGVYDALIESRGTMLAADNCEVLQAMHLFKQSEGIDIDPAAGVAFATLMNRAKAGRIRREAVVLLHITGGGSPERQSDKQLAPAQPTLEIPASDPPCPKAIEQVLELFQ